MTKSVNQLNFHYFLPKLLPGLPAKSISTSSSAAVSSSSSAFTADFAVVRALLRAGRNYEQAVSLFSPYRAVGEPDPPTREALARIADRARRSAKPAYVFINNRLEGHAPTTIEAVADALEMCG